jgi:hypothetical protein
MSKKPALSLQEALDQADDVLELLNSQNIQRTATNIDAIRQEVSQKTYERAESLSQALQHYQSLVKQDEQFAQRAETEGKTAFDVKFSKESLFNGKKTLSEYKHYKESEMREINVIQHQIHRINADLQGEDDLVGEIPQNGHNDGNGEEHSPLDAQSNTFFHEQHELVSDIQQLEDEYATLSAKLNIFQLFSHIQFIPSEDPNIVKGLATLQNIGDVRPFEIDLRLTPKEDIRDMVWGWLYDEHCC